MAEKQVKVYKPNKDSINLGVDLNRDGTLDQFHVQQTNSVNERYLGDGLQNIEIVRHGVKTNVLAMRVASEQFLGAVRIGRGLSVDKGLVEIDQEFIDSYIVPLRQEFDQFKLEITTRLDAMETNIRQDMANAIGDIINRLEDLEEISESGKLTPSEIINVGRDEITYVDNGDGTVTFTPPLKDDNYIVMAALDGNFLSQTGEFAIESKTAEGFAVDTTGIPADQIALDFILAVPDDVSKTAMGVAHFAGYNSETVITLPTDLGTSSYGVFLTLQGNQDDFEYGDIGEFFVTNKTQNQFTIKNTGAAGAKFGYLAVPYSVPYNGHWFPIYLGVTNTSVVTLPHEMQNIDYDVVVTPNNSNGEAGEYSIINKTTTSFEIANAGNNTFAFDWMVRGQRRVV